MKIEKIRIQNFRNLTSVYYEAQPGLNVFLGDNAQGKTSFLEAIYLLSRPVSFRPAKDQDLLQYDEQYFRVEARCCQKEEAYKLAVFYDPAKGRKDFFCNEKKSNYKDPHLLKVVLFTPDDLSLIKGTPSRRRRFLDFILCQLYPHYEKSFSEYQSLLKKRNLLLRNEQRNSPGFTAVNELFIHTAASLLWERIRLSALLEQLVREIFPCVYLAGMQAQLRYALSFPLPSEKITPQALERGLEKQLSQNTEKENRAFKTLCGPHLDDFNVYLNGRLARNFASQGQQRSLAVTLKMAEVRIYQKIKGETPVFLLDEVLSELDLTKKQQLLRWLKEAGVQSFLTALNLEGLSEGEEMHVTHFYQGQIKEDGK